MIRVRLTGMSGTGKSAVIVALATLSYPAVDLDEDGFSELVEVDGDEVTGPGMGRTGSGGWTASRICLPLTMAPCCS